jgi:hypothetical protein
MAPLSFEERRQEIISLLEHGEEEFDKGRPLIALSMLFEAQYVLNETVQNAMEGTPRFPSYTANAGRRSGAVYH